MTREELHQLVDTLPEAALEPAKQSLQYFQIWPPQPPPRIEQMREAHRERFLLSMRPGTAGGAGGVGAILREAAVRVKAVVSRSVIPRRWSARRENASFSPRP